MIAIDGCYGIGPPRRDCVDPLKVKCPACMSAPGSLCTNNAGHEFNKAHDIRRKHAHEVAVIKYKSRGRKKVAKGGWGMPK